MSDVQAPGDVGEPPARRLAILSFSSGEFDARSFRVAGSAIAAGWDVVVYARWYPGLAPSEQRDGYQLIRVDADPRQALPLIGGLVRRRRREAILRAPVVGGRTDIVPPAKGPSVGPRAPATVRRRFSGNPLTWPYRFSVRKLRGWRRMLARWQTAVLMFPLRPLGWARAVEDVAEPAEIWHGMWAGSLPALARLGRRHGGATIYDSRDVYMLSRNFMSLEWPVRPLLARAERRWAHQVDQVLTVNDAYAGLIAGQLGVPRPPVVLNTPSHWTPPVPPPDRIREATGIPHETFVILYQGQLMSQRGIEQSMQAILELPDAALVLLGFGIWEEHLRDLAAAPPFAGRVFVLPAVTPEELLAWTASADVMVMPIQPTSTNHEFTTPQKLWEAIAAGVPVVASDLPGMAEIIGSEGIGALCDPTSPSSIAEAIRSLVGQPPEERAALRRHVLEVGHERYTWERQSETLFELYGSLLPDLGHQ
jgi:glycosyltransferase involved in cell wall biosynthesis